MSGTGPFFLGIDLGGTKIEVAVLDAAHHTVFRERVSTEAEGGPRHILSRIGGLYRRACAAISGTEHSIGIGTPGALSHRTGLLKNSNTVCLNGLALDHLIAAELAHGVTIENDANCFALAEAVMGAGRGYPWVFGVIMGTGCGGGLVADGRLRKGPQSLCGEWGHMSIDPSGPLCYCGQRGCVERYISGGGLQDRFRDATGLAFTAEEIVARARDGDRAAVQVMEDFHRHFGRALANLIDIVDPDAVVLGGGLSNLDSLYAQGIAQVAAQVFSDELTTPVLRNQLGDSAGVIGAALVGAAMKNPLPVGRGFDH